MDNIRTIGDLKLMTVEEFASFSRTTSGVVYTRMSTGEYLKELYVHIGRKPYFIEKRVAEWILNGAPLNKKSLNKKISA